LVDEVKADLVWHLEFEGNLDDTAGHASGPYNATEVAPPIAGGTTAFVPDGRIGQALAFDGNEVRIDVPGTASPMTEFTISLFMKSGEEWYNSSNALVTKPGWTTGNFVMRIIPNEDNEMWNDVGNTSLGVGGDFWSGSHPAYMDRWNHFAITYSVTAGETKLYFDGVEAASATGSSEPVEFNDGFTLGSWNYSDDQPYNDRLVGQLDDVRFYDEALDADAIADLASAVSSKAAHDPEPANKATGIPVVGAILSWKTGLDPVDANVPNPAITGHNLWLSIVYDPTNPPVEPDWLDPGVQIIQLPADVNPTDGSVDEMASYAPVLQRDALYFWIVDESLGAADPLDWGNIIQGSQWSFGTVTSGPEVDAGSNMITWLEEDATIVDLKGTVTDETNNVTAIQWSVVLAPFGATVDITNNSVAATTATLTQTGRYELELYAIDATQMQDSDMMEINVYGDSCEAAKNNPNGYTAPLYDFNNDCKVNFIDFAMFATEWLRDESLDQDALYD